MNKQELGRVGHFIDGINCRFFRHTHINNVYCVSTIGDYWPTKQKQEPLGVWFGDKNLGDWRYYETRVFNLLDEAKRWVDSDFLFSLKIDGRDYINEKDALEGHEKIVAEYARKIVIKNQDSEQDNPWILCSERLPKKDGYYLVTVKLKDCIDSFCFVLEDEFLNGEWTNHKKEMVFSWKYLLEPDRKSVKLENMSRDKKNFIVNLDDQLMGWIPIWVEKPKEFTIVNLFLEDDEIGWGYRNDDNIFYSSREHIRYNRKVIAWRETNPDEQSIPDFELFFEPSPPKHQLFDLKFVPFSSFKPWKTGEYLLYDKETNTYKTIKINKSNLDCRIDNYDSYTHWALVREEK